METEGSTESTEQRVEQEAPVTGIAKRMADYEAEQSVKAGAPKPARHDPAPGLLHIYDEKTGVWVVRRDPDYREPGEEPSSERAAAKQDDSDVNDTYKRGGDQLV